MPHRGFLLSCAAFVFACGVNFAQINTAAIYGTVTDQAAGIIPNAHIQVKNELTNVAASTTSNSRGDFTFNFLPIGNYDVSVEATGFQRQIRNDVELSAGQTLHIDVQLRLGNIQESITVSGSAPLLNLDGSEQH